MNKKIFRSTITVSLCVLFVGILLIMLTLSEYFEASLKNQLKSEIEYIALAVENGAEFKEKIGSESNRITLIAPDGTVISDTSANPLNMENHKNREEITEAMKNGEGESIRYSETLTEKTVYYAKRLSDGRILRVSSVQYTFFVLVLGILYPLILIIVGAIVLSFILSGRVSAGIVRPINALDLNNPSENTAYEELSPLLAKIASQKRIIGEQLADARKKQEEFLLITENMSEGFIVTDDKAGLLTCNSAVFRLFKVKIEKYEHIGEITGCEGLAEAVKKALSGQKEEICISFGESFYRIVSNPVKEQEKVIGTVTVIMDVTENAKREQLRREFTSNVSHELKTPLTSISGFAEMMLTGDLPSESVADFSKTIYEEAGRMITLVSDIIKISELDEKSPAFEKENVDLYRVCTEIAERLRPQAESRNIDISVRGDRPVIFAVGKILEEIIYNLADNGIKYNIPGGRVEIVTAALKDGAMITVRDNGVGIPAEHHDRIFERFYRVDKSHSRKIGGTGLGLSIVKHGVLYHNGEIIFESEENKGTVISVKIPFGE